MRSKTRSCSLRGEPSRDDVVASDGHEHTFLPHSIGEPVELSSKFIRYSTFRTGKEQLVSQSCDSVDHMTLGLGHAPSGEQWEPGVLAGTARQDQLLWPGLPQYVPSHLPPLHQCTDSPGLPGKELLGVSALTGKAAWQYHTSRCRAGCQRYAELAGMCVTTCV